MAYDFFLMETLLRNVVQLANQMEGDHWGDLGVDGWIILG